MATNDKVGDVAADIYEEELDDNGNILEMRLVEDRPLIELPDMNWSPVKIPTIRIKSIHFENYKVFEDAFFDLTDKDGVPHNFCCFHGPNGCGKTTILNCMQTIFSRFDGYDKERLTANLGKSIRRKDTDQTGVHLSDNFLITVAIECEGHGEYFVRLDKNGFKDNHPDDIKEMLYRLCFFAKFDMELDKFQLTRTKWYVFKDLFESVTGFKIEEINDMFSFGADPIQNKIMKDYVLGFKIHKPNETISNRDCSAGERKIIKSFSTLLNKEHEPQIILVDNIAMHVESGRHLNLVHSMRRCFPNSQVFSTTHSYNISKNFADRSQLFDLRMLDAKGRLKRDQWRIYLIDEIRESLLKLKALCRTKDEKVDMMITFGSELIASCHDSDDVEEIQKNVESFVFTVSRLYIRDIIAFYSEK